MQLLSAEQFAGFLGAAVLLTLAPGPDNLMVLALGASRGRSRGMAFGLGCALGCLSHTLLAALGVSAVIAGVASGIHRAQGPRRALLAATWVAGAAQQRIDPAERTSRCDRHTPQDVHARPRR